MSLFKKSVLLVTVCAVLTPAYAGAVAINVERIDAAMKRFVRAPHPMGSAEQKKYTAELKADLTKQGWAVQGQKFTATVPNPTSSKLGGHDKKAEAVKQVQGENLIAISAGIDHCLLLIGGHYDTKPYASMRFVGANDGGSSTALMQELARAITQIRQQEGATKKTSGRLLDCSIGLVFFDGEEAVLPEWTDGETQLGLKDNTYGSRFFAESLVKGFAGLSFQGIPVKAAVIIDMVGHREQNLLISKGSDRALSQKLLDQKKKVALTATNLPMEDDHVPLAQRGIPYVHVIDWVNLNEWHKADDTLAIVSNRKIADFGDVLLAFLQQAR